MTIRCLASPSPRLALLAVLLAGVGTQLLAQEPGVKIAVVDLDRVILQSAAGKELQARLERFEAEVRTDAREQIEKANQLRSQAADQAQGLTAQQAAALQKQYEDATIAIRRFQDDKQREGRNLQETGLKEIRRQLRPVFEKIHEEWGYDLILNNTPGVVVMARGSVDITNQVIEKLNSMAGSSGGSK